MTGPDPGDTGGQPGCLFPSGYPGPDHPGFSSDLVPVSGTDIPRYTGEFWTSGQRTGCSIHEISYRGCFKPQLPGFFIERLTSPGDLVYDPFSGRGTTVIEAGLRGRRVVSNDRNPLSEILTRPRFTPPEPGTIPERLSQIPVEPAGKGTHPDLSMFYHPETLSEILALREYLSARDSEGLADPLDSWIRMVATNRLTGHSRGFFSVYTLPPNQAVSPARQQRINKLRNQAPEYRDTRAIISSKTASLQRNLTGTDRARLAAAGAGAVFLSEDARETGAIPSDSVALTVTSPPFLDVVQYSQDNWLRCWFNGIDAGTVGKQITMARTVDEWSGVIGGVFRELFRITRIGGHVAFEVGEVRKGTIRLDECVVPLGIGAGFSCLGILVNLQSFTKTSNIWGIGNNRAGTNTNRIVLFRKE